MTKAFKWSPDTTFLKSNLELCESNSFYSVHLPVFKKNCEEFYSAFSEIYPNVRLAYSVKSNYLPTFIQAIDSYGWFSEVVSGFEFDLVRGLGIKGENIIFNGPIKSEAEIIKAINNNSILNIDNISELVETCKIAEQVADEPVEVGLRLNFNNEISSISRFGITTGEELTQALMIINQSEKLQLSGIHTHYCFANKNPSDYTELVSALVEILLSRNLLTNIKYINIGGGFFSKMPSELAKQWGKPIPSYNDYAQAISKPLSKLLTKASSDNLPQLILEPGLAILADAMSFVCEVKSIKLSSTVNTVILTGSVYNVKPTKSKADMPFSHIAKVESPNTKPIKAQLTGYTCMEDDVISSSFEGVVSEGDIFIFHNVGAYSNVLKPPFIRLSPSFIIEENDGSYSKHKYEETLETSISDRFNLDNEKFN